MSLPVVYTSFPRGTARLLDPLPVPPGQARMRPGRVDDDAVLVAYLDDSWRHTGTAWAPEPVRGSYCLDPLMRSLQVKVAHAPVPEGSTSLWVDPGVEFRDDLDVGGMASAYLQASDLCAFAHPRYCCAYEYAEELRATFPGRAPVISGQVDRYLREGFPGKWGLYDTSVMLRRNTERMREICSLWWREVLLGDQDEVLSLSYALWKTGDALAVTFPGRMGVDFTPGVVEPPRVLPPCNPYFRRTT